MDPNISLKEEIYKASHYWPYPVLAFIIGSLVGLVVSFAFPPTYKAEVDFLISYNDLQACRNPDDCKNWMLSQMDIFARSETILGPTLAQLQSQDDYWMEVSLEDLSEMFDVLWRNTGRWRFIAENRDSARSEAAIDVWSEVYIEEYQKAREHALNLFDLNARSYALNQSKVQTQARLTLLNSVQDDFMEFRTSMGTFDSSKPLNSEYRWDLYNLAAQADGNNIAWQDLMDSFPLEEDLVSAYSPWVDQLGISLEQEIHAVNNQLDQLNNEIDATLELIALETESSHGLSHAGDVQRLPVKQPKVEATRNTSTVIVLGGITGLLIWGLIWIARPIWLYKK